MPSLLVVFLLGFIFSAIEVVAENVSATNTSTMNACQKRPVDMKSVQYCCDIPTPKLDFYQTDCQFPLIQRRAESDLFCFFECIGKVSHAVENLDLNVTAVNELLTHLFSNAAFIDGFSKSFEDCSASLKSKISVFKRKFYASGKKPGKCSPIPLLYGLCGYFKLLKYCPKSLWHNSKSCEASRSYIVNCEEALFEWVFVKNKKKKKKTPKL